MKSVAILLFAVLCIVPCTYSAPRDAIITREIQEREILERMFFDQIASTFGNLVTGFTSAIGGPTTQSQGLIGGIIAALRSVIQSILNLLAGNPGMQIPPQQLQMLQTIARFVPAIQPLVTQLASSPQNAPALLTMIMGILPGALALLSPQVLQQLQAALNGNTPIPPTPSTLTPQQIQAAQMALTTALNQVNTKSPVSVNDPIANTLRQQIQQLQNQLMQNPSTLTSDQLNNAVNAINQAANLLPAAAATTTPTAQQVQAAQAALTNALNQVNAKSPVSANDPTANAVRQAIQNLQNQLAQNPLPVTNDQLNTALTGINQAVAAVPAASTAATPQEIQNAVSQLNNLLAQVNTLSPVSANDPAANAVRQSIQALITALGQPNSALTGAQINGAIATIIQALQQVQAPAANTPLGTTLSGVNALLGNLLTTLGLGGLNTGR